MRPFTNSFVWLLLTLSIETFPSFFCQQLLLKSKSSLTSYECSTHGQPIYYAAFGLYRFDRKKFTGLWLDTKRHLPENFIHQLKAYFAQRTIFVAASNYAAGAVSFFSRGFLTWTDLADCLLIKSTNYLINKADKNIPSFKLSWVLEKRSRSFSCRLMPLGGEIWRFAHVFRIQY